MSEYTPNEQELIEGSTVSADERRRAIARIKADVLREARDDLRRRSTNVSSGHAQIGVEAAVDCLDRRADRIEEAGL